jgi:hypothetical protein
MVLAIPLLLLLGASGADALHVQAVCPEAIGSDVDRDGIDDFCDDAFVSPLTPPAPAPGYGARKILVAHLKFPEFSPPPFDIEETRRRLVGPQPFSVTQFFSEISFGAAEQTYDIRPWADLPHDRAFYQAGDQYGNQLVNDALAYVGAHYDLNGVDIIVLMVPQLDFGYPGVYAYIPPGVSIGDSGYRLPVAVLTQNSAFNGSSSASHEIGHAYGFLHSSVVVCKSWPFGIPPALTDLFFSDESCEIFPNQREAILAYAGYDFMGSLAGHPNAFLKWQAGWLKPSQIIEAPTSGSFVLDSYEVASPGAKTVRIPYGIDADGKAVAFWIEYRAKPAVDLENRNLKSYPTDRVLIWVNLPGAYATSTSFNFSTTIPTPLQPDGMQLPVGGKFTDPYRGLRITRGANSIVDGVKRSTITVETSSLKFAPSVGMKLDRQDARDVRVTNAGTAPVTFGPVKLMGRNPSAFHIAVDTCSGMTLQKDAQCVVLVDRTAEDIFLPQARIQFATNDPLWPSPAIGLIGLSSTVLPAAPEIGTPTPADGSVNVFFNPRFLGNGSLVHYTAVCTGGTSSTGTSSPIVVRGLTNGIATRCVVKTTSSIGDSEWSLPSTSVTPIQGPRRRVVRK